MLSTENNYNDILQNLYKKPKYWKIISWKMQEQERNKNLSFTDDTVVYIESTNYQNKNLENWINIKSITITSLHHKYLGSII